MALATAHFLLSLYSKSPLYPVLEFLESSMYCHHEDVKTISGSKKVTERVSRTSSWPLCSSLVSSQPLSRLTDDLCSNMYFR